MSAATATPPKKRPPSFKLTPEQIELFGEELDALRERVIEDLGQRDSDYIHKVMKTQRNLEVAGRGLLFLSFIPSAWIAGTTALAVAKILDNMEIGHNIMHDQYDWTHDPALDGHDFEWDNASTGDDWRDVHNYQHHTYTNVVGLDRDMGYGLLRVTERQPWHPYFLGNAVYAFLLAVLFEYGVAVYNLEIDRMRRGKVSLADKREEIDRTWRKISKQATKDYLLFPALGGPVAPLIFAGNVTANVARNVWAFMVIFCGHLPSGIEEFERDEIEDETRAEWYYRQVIGSGNLTGPNLLHVLTGNLSYHIEHHLFPDIPANRYAEISVEVKEACARFGIPYNEGSMPRQFGSVVKKLVRLALP